MPDQDSARLLAELDELRSQAETLSARLAANLDPQLRYTGEDPQGLTRVTVDGHGRTTDVVVSRDWRLALDATGLAGALIVAIGVAENRRLEAWAAGAAPSDPAATAAPVAGLLIGREPHDHSLAEASGTDLIRSLLPLLDEAERQLDETATHLEKRFNDETTITGSDGQLSAQAQGGLVTKIEFGVRWISSANADEIAHRVCLLLQDAYDRAWQGIGDLLPQELGALMSLAEDPEQMLRRLGLST